jgi:hypothetical protein
MNLGELLAQVLPLALGAAVSPVLVIAVVAILSGPRSMSRGAAFTAGVALVTVLVLGVGYLLIGATHHTAGHTRGPLGSPTARVIVGALLLGLGLRLLLHRPAPKPGGGPLMHRLTNPDTPTAGFFGLGVGAMALNASSLVLLVAVVHEVSRANARTGTATIALVVVGLIAIAPAALPLLAARVGGDRTGAGIARAGDLLGRYGRLVIAVMLLVFGAQDLLQGLARL